MQRQADGERGAAGPARHVDRPLCACTTAATIASPSPVLPAACDLEPSPRENRSKTSGNRRAGNARPVVRDHHNGLGVVAGRISVTVTDVPGGVCVRAFASRLVRTWCSRGRVAGNRRPARPEARGSSDAPAPLHVRR